MGIGKELWVLVLIYESRRWLVQVQVLCLSCYSCGICLSLFFSFLSSLDLLEFIKYILVVEKSVGKLFLEDILVQEIMDSILDAFNFKKLMDSWSLSWISLKHHGKDIRNIS